MRRDWFDENNGVALDRHYQQMKDVEQIIEDHVTACNAGTLMSEVASSPELAR